MSYSRLVAILAFTCEPNLGSEYEVGWRWAEAAGKTVRAIVLTRRASFSNIPLKEIADGRFGVVKIGPNGTVFKAIDFPGADVILKGRVAMRSHYLIWQILVFFWLKKRSREFAFVHHVCFVAAWFPPLCAFLGLPFVWGPIGTGAALPVWARAGVRSHLWNFVTQKLNRINPLVNQCVKRCDLTIPINSHVATLIDAGRSKRSVVFPAIAQDHSGQRNLRSRYMSIEQATIVYCGRFTPFKLPELAMRTGELILEEFPQLTFVMVGEGITKLTKKTGSAIRFMESIRQDMFLEMLEGSQLLLFPTTEGSGFVALEAMSRGIPIVCTENSGPATFIGADGGVAVPLGDSFEGTAQQLAEACRKVLRDETTWRGFSRGASDRAKEYTWDKLVEMLRMEYRRLL